MGELMRLLLILTFVLSANGAFAHVGHIADVAGHGHWVGAAAIFGPIASKECSFAAV